MNFLITSPEGTAKLEDKIKQLKDALSKKNVAVTFTYKKEGNDIIATLNFAPENTVTRYLVEREFRGMLSRFDPKATVKVVKHLMK